MCKSTHLCVLQPRFLYSQSPMHNQNQTTIFERTNLLESLSPSRTSARMLVNYIFRKKTLFKEKKATSIPVAVQNLLPKSTRITTSFEKTRDFSQVFGPAIASTFTKCSNEHLESKNQHRLKSAASILIMLSQDKKEEQIGFHPSSFQTKLSRRRKTNLPRHLRKCVDICYIILQKSKKSKIYFLHNFYCPSQTMTYTNENINQLSRDELERLLFASLKLHTPISKVW